MGRLISDCPKEEAEYPDDDVDVVEDCLLTEFV